MSPAAGEVVERLCNQGQLLQAGATQCFTLSDMSRVWILVNIYQNDIAYVKVGDNVTITNETYPGSVRGTIQYIAPSLDPTTRTLQARIEAANPGERLKKDMYVTADLQAGTIPDAIAVPDAAILRDGQNLPYVYIVAGDRQFGQRSITIGDSQGGKTHVLTGLRAGDRIVGDGSLFLQFQNTLQ
jgi:cobalt-zinc-cadmium efflux system membrane fusion protein